MMRLTTNIFTAWLRDQMTTHPSQYSFPIFDGRQPDTPDRCATALKVGLGADRLEGAFEEFPIRLQSRGRSESLDDAEYVANYLDDIMFNLHPTSMSGVLVVDAWVVNKVKMIPITDRQSRFQFTADYMLLAART